jgi:hypothetical protein
MSTTTTAYTCRPGPHWFAYYGWVRSSSPVCVRCGAENPRYRPNDDPFRKEPLNG